MFQKLNGRAVDIVVLISVVSSIMFASISLFATKSEVRSLHSDVREIRGDVKQILRGCVCDKVR